MTEELLERRGGEVDKIVATTGSAARVDAWGKLLAGAGAEIFEFFAYRPVDVMEVFARRLEDKRRWSTLAEIYETWHGLAAGAFTAGAGMASTVYILVSAVPSAASAPGHAAGSAPWPWITCRRNSPPAGSTHSG